MLGRIRPSRAVLRFLAIPSLMLLPFLQAALADGEETALAGGLSLRLLAPGKKVIPVYYQHGDFFGERNTVVHSDFVFVNVE